MPFNRSVQTLYKFHIAYQELTYWSPINYTFILLPDIPKLGNSIY